MTTSHVVQGRSALIAYGSETGNSQDYAEELGRLLQRIHFSVHVSELDAVETVGDGNLDSKASLTWRQSSLNRYTVVIIVISTVGQGELPINSRVFWKSLLRKKLPNDYLKGVAFTTFGLGDTTYAKYDLPSLESITELICF